MFGFFKGVQDPVCKMKVDKNKAKYPSDYKGERYYFCSENCKKQFDADPQSFITKEDMNHSCCQNKENSASNKSCC